MNARLKIVLSLLLASIVVHAPVAQEREPLPVAPFHLTPEMPGLDSKPPLSNDAALSPGPKASGPIAPAGTQPVGALSGRIVFTSGGHGWAWSGSGWALGRGVLNQMNEDYGNVDQMTLFAYYCFNAGATVVPFRPIGNQTNEVILDNVSPNVTWSGAWAGSSSTVYFGNAGAVPYRYASLAATETATATYTPNIPAAGFYPVYTWALSGSNRTNQLYRIHHTGGQSLVRVPHHMVGNGWVWLGNYFFNAGSNAASGSVVISNLGEGTPGASVVVADAIRFGNGMGDVDQGGGVSGYPREEECSRYWVQRAVGQGQSSTLYDNPSLIDSDDNVGAPPRMAAEMNREAAGNMFKRVLISFHSNAGGGRGVTGLFNNESLFPGTSTSTNQFRLAQLVGTEVNNDLVGIGAPPLEVAWSDRGANVTYARTDYAFGEIRGDAINYEMDATIVEVAFHDDASDAQLLRDSKARNWVARACCQAVVRYMNQFDGLALNFLPEPPVIVRAIATNNGITVSWGAPVAQGGSGAAAGFVLYRSTDGYGFGNPIGASGGSATSFTFTNLAADADFYFRVAATNAGGESLPSETVGCRRASSSLATKVLFVNGFDRFDRTLNLRQTPAAQNYKPPGHDANTGTMDRVLPGRVNSFDYVVPHGKAISGFGLPFDSCSRAAVTNSQVALTNYGIVVWGCGNQSTAVRTFNNVEQTKVTAFLAAGGNLFVSGSEIAWDLDRASGPSAADRNFLHNQLHAALGNDTNDDSGVYSFTPASGSIFAGNPTGSFDDGSKGIYWVGYPDALTPTGAGAKSALSYPGYTGGAAGIVYDGSAGGGKVVYLGFPFETITSASARTNTLADALRYFLKPPKFDAIAALPASQVKLTLRGEPGQRYAIDRSATLTSWAPWTNILNATGMVEVLDGPLTNATPRFYRASLVP